MSNLTCVNCNHSRSFHNHVGKYCLVCRKNCDFLPEKEEYSRHGQRLEVLRFATHVVKFRVVSENGTEPKEFCFTRKYFDEVFLPNGRWRRVSAAKPAHLGVQV